MRRKLEVSTAMAWESLVDTHVAEATAFVALLADRLPLEESLTRYLREMDMSETMATAIRTRVLLALEAPELPAGPGNFGHGSGAPVPLQADGGEGWRRFMPHAVVRGVIERQRQSEETERVIGLALARSEEAIIRTHVENAISFAALLENHVPLDRGVQQYLGAVVLTGCRGQVVFQRTMARLAEVHLPS
ncbi:MAG TPA: hypothetical protein VK939_14240 [Longimicrobiales bacterium]|nr:hypothetical protein [Longimicrobiales bacterium]